MAQKQSLPGLLPSDSKLNILYVEISKIAVGHSNDILKISALGSCIGLVLYPKNKPRSDRCAVMGHIMLPESHKRVSQKNQNTRTPPAKYSDQAVPAMVAELKSLGHHPKNLEAKMAGGAKMFGNSSDTFDIGKENVRITKKVLKEMDISLVNHYIGGNKGMNIIFTVSNSKLIVT
ncbi:MAG: chemotaxis protein CheD, partial [Candidatus Hodarchaeales archaeon]